MIAASIKKLEKSLAFLSSALVFQSVVFSDWFMGSQAALWKLKAANVMGFGVEGVEGGGE